MRLLHFCFPCCVIEESPRRHTHESSGKEVSNMRRIEMKHRIAVRADRPAAGQGSSWNWTWAYRQA